MTTIVSAGGDALERYVYSPYGLLTIYDVTWSNIRSASNYDIEYTYTGRRYDKETGLYYYRHRMLSAQLGRFISRDPIGYRGGWSLVGYVRNAPTRFLDPHGRDFFDWMIEIGANPGSVKTLEDLWNSPWQTIVDTANPESVDTAQRLINDPIGTLIEEANPASVETLVSLYENFWGTVAEQCNPGPGAFFGAELHGIVGVGASEVVRCDAQNKKHHYVFRKWCVGGNFGGTIQVGPVNMRAERCDPDNYSGWFAEGGFGFGIDVGLSHLSERYWIIPWDLSGTVEGGPYVGFGPPVSLTLCHYTLIDEDVVGCCD